MIRERVVVRIGAGNKMGEGGFEGHVGWDLWMSVRIENRVFRAEDGSPGIRMGTRQVGH